MLELMTQRAETPSETRIRTFAASPAASVRSMTNRWGDQAVTWLQTSVVPLVLLRRSDPLVATLSRIAASAHEPGEVRLALVGLAGAVTGADRAELFRDRWGRDSSRLACWPPSAPNGPFVLNQAHAQPTSRGPIARAISGAWSRRPATLEIPVQVGGSTFATLRLTAGRSRAWPSRMVRRLETLCSIAGIAERALACPRPAFSARGHAAQADVDSGTQGSASLDVLLGFGLALARRRREPISLLIVAVDRLAATRELLGEELAESAVNRASRAVRSTLRISDQLIRLEDGRLAVILPEASTDAALQVAESVRSAVARSRAGSTTTPTLTVSIGVATYPDHSGDAATLRAVACSALSLAVAEGQNRVGRAPSPERLDDTP